MSHETAEVLVIGGGPAGCALSLRLARIGCPVALLELTAYQEFRPGESLPPSVVPRLAELGVWQPFLATQPEPAYGIESAWGTGDLDSSSFLANPFLNGWHLNRPRFDAMLSSAAEAAGARVFRRTTLRSIERGPQYMWSVNATSQHEELHFLARFVVDATGRAGRLCARLGIPPAPPTASWVFPRFRRTNFFPVLCLRWSNLIPSDGGIRQVCPVAMLSLSSLPILISARSTPWLAPTPGSGHSLSRSIHAPASHQRFRPSRCGFFLQSATASSVLAEIHGWLAETPS